MKSLIKLLSIAICLTSCDLITPTPKMFSCKVNGKLWEPITPGPLGGRLTSNATFYTKQNYFSVYGSSDECFIGIILNLPPNTNLELNKKYPIQLLSAENMAKASFRITLENPRKQDYRVEANSGYIKITKMDTQYFSGSFEFDLEKEILSKKYKIRKGQFNNMLYGKDETLSLI